MSAVDFVDYTNVTEIEKFEFKLNNLMKGLRESADNNDAIPFVMLQFREVDFKLSRISSLDDDPILRGIPNFRYDNLIQKSFDLNELWLLECTDKSRVVSEATGRLLLGALIQASGNGEASFVHLGEMEKSETYIGFRKRNATECKSEYFETFSNVNFADSDSNILESAQLILEWLPNDLRITFPGFCGYFDAWHPIERIQVTCVWPQIPRDGLNFKREELESAPIWIAEYEESELEGVPLRNTTLRSIQSTHLREVLFTEMGNVKLVNIIVTRDQNTRVSDSIESVYEALAQAYRRETEKMETDVTARYNFIPKRVQETMRIERLNESASLIWRQFIRALETAWNDLNPIKTTDFNSSGEIENSVKLINWCIEREIEWQGLLKEHALLRKLYRIPPRQQYTEPIDAKIEAMEGKLTDALAEMSELKRELEYNGSEYTAEITDTEFDSSRKVLTFLFSHSVYEPVVLNCEPPPSKFMTKSLLNTPLAGEVIALNQLREDMRVFKAWNAEICAVACIINKSDGAVNVDPVDNKVSNNSNNVQVDLGFIGFLQWHSPNDVESSENGVFVSQRMRDNEGQWLNLWRGKKSDSNSDSERCIDSDSHGDSDNNTYDSHTLQLSQLVSFNHRALLGQVLSDLALKTDLRLLLESATPFLMRRAVELLGLEAEKILEEVIEANDGNGDYPLDELNRLLDVHEKELTKRLALEALCADIFASDAKRVLVSRENQREFLMNKQHEFKVKRKEVVKRGSGSEFRELVSGFEAIKVELSY